MAHREGKLASSSSVTRAQCQVQVYREMVERKRRPPWMKRIDLANGTKTSLEVPDLALLGHEGVNTTLRAYSQS